MITSQHSSQSAGYYLPKYRNRQKGILSYFSPLSVELPKTDLFNNFFWLGNVLISFLKWESIYSLSSLYWVQISWLRTHQQRPLDFPDKGGRPFLICFCWTCVNMISAFLRAPFFLRLIDFWKVDFAILGKDNNEKD